MLKQLDGKVLVLTICLEMQPKNKVDFWMDR